MKKEYTKKLNNLEKAILIEKGTEPPYSGNYNNFFESGEYGCRACGNKLFSSKNKFISDCGWPAFDKEKKGSINMELDNSFNLLRVEINCSNCGGHLGHLFKGEGYTKENTRFCVNSLSLEFKSDKK